LTCSDELLAYTCFYHEDPDPDEVGEKIVHSSVRFWAEGQMFKAFFANIKSNN
jgi:hypothetical protein